MSPSFVNIFVSWSANAPSFWSDVLCLVMLLRSSVVVSVGFSEFIIGRMTLFSFRQASLFPSVNSMSLQYRVQLFCLVCRVYCLIVLFRLL